MKIVRPNPKQLATLVQAMYGVISNQGSLTPAPIEVRSIEAIQVHLFGLAENQIVTGAPGPLPITLEQDLDSVDIRRMTVQLLVILSVVGRKVRSETVEVAAEAARRLDIDEPGIEILRKAARGQHKRIAFALMKRFVDWWSPGGKAGFRDWGRFMWWMLPQLHGKGTVRRQRALLTRYEELGKLPEDTFGRTLHDFYAHNDIALPGAPKSVPWIMHEVYHVLSEYGVHLEAELLLTAFVGGSLDENCLDQVLFGLLSYQTGSQIIGGVISEGLLDPDDYFRAMARGAAITVDLVHGWDVWEVAEMNIHELRTRYNIPALTDWERARITAYNGLLCGSGYSTRPDARAQGASVSDGLSPAMA
jgi:hypothetical protein